MYCGDLGVGVPKTRSFPLHFFPFLLDAYPLSRYTMRMEFDPSYSPSEPFEADETPLCANCCDTGTFYTDEGGQEFCDCESGCALEENHDSDNDPYEGGYFEDDADALASAGMGTDEDYGYYGGDEW